MRTKFKGISILACFCSIISSGLAPTSAAENQPIPALLPASTSVPRAVTQTVDTEAIKALDGVANSLRKLTSFTLESATSFEVVLESGQKIQLDGKTLYRARRPDGLFVELDSDRKLRQIYYDGKNLTVYAPKRGYYATVETRAHTLGELVTNASRDYGIALPLADLFFWGTESMDGSSLTSALYVGPAIIDGKTTQQYAFRQPGVDWQIWVANETQLPSQIVITNTDDPALPEYRARLTWDTATAVPVTSFKFKAPADATSIVLALPSAESNKN